MVGWIEMRRVVDNFVFADQDSPGFDRWDAWRAAIAGMNHVELDEVLVELGDAVTIPSGTYPTVRYWIRLF